MDGELVNQVIQNTKNIKSMMNQRRSTIVRKYGEEHDAGFVGNTATFYLPVDTDMEYISELQVKLVLGSMGTGGTIAAGNYVNAVKGINTYATYLAWISAYPEGTAVDCDGNFGCQSLIPDSTILGTDYRYFKVEDIIAGDKVFDKNCKLINTIANNDTTEEELIEIRTSSGYVTGTLGHKMFVDGKAIELQNLQRGMVIDSPYINGIDLGLTSDQYRFLGAWLGDGTIAYKGSTVNGIFITVGTKKKEAFLRGLGVDLSFTMHSNKKAKIARLLATERNRKLREVIIQYRDKKIPVLREGAEQVIQGYIITDGTWKRSHQNVITSTNKELLSSISDMAWNLGYKATLSRKMLRKPTNLCSHPKPIYRLSINFSPKRFYEKGYVISTKRIGKGLVYHTNVIEPNHSYITGGLASHNCWDYACAFWYAQCNRKLQTGSNHAASDCWNQSRVANAGSEFDLITDKTQIKQGDIVVFGGNSYGHIGMAGDNYSPGDTIPLWGQNQGGYPMPKGGAAVNIINKSLSDFLGAFRYKRWHS